MTPVGSPDVVRKRACVLGVDYPSSPISAAEFSDEGFEDSTGVDSFQAQLEPSSSYDSRVGWSPINFPPSRRGMPLPQATPSPAPWAARPEPSQPQAGPSRPSQPQAGPSRPSQPRHVPSQTPQARPSQARPCPVGSQTPGPSQARPGFSQISKQPKSL